MIKTGRIILGLAFIILFTLAGHSQAYSAPSFQVIDSSSKNIRIHCDFDVNDISTSDPIFYILLPDSLEIEDVKITKLTIGNSYVSNKRLSEHVIKSHKIITIRDYRILKVELKSSLKLPKDKILNFTQIEVDILLKQTISEFTQNKSATRFWNRIVSHIILNPEALPKLKSRPKDSGVEYIIISDPIFSSQLNRLKNFRIQQGITTEIFLTSEIGASVDEIKSFITNTYNTWNIPPVAILLLGDESLIPAPIWESYCLSDNMYADVNNDDLPEFTITRLPFSTTDEFENYLDRIIEFEFNPPQNEEYYTQALAITDYSNHFSNSWMLTEIMNGWYEKGMGKTPVRQYLGNPTPQSWPSEDLYLIFGSQGLGYIPESPAYLMEYNNGSSQDINDVLNAGTMSFTGFTAGSTSGWASPEYTIQDFAGLVKSPPSTLFSISGQTGDFGQPDGECFAEAYLKHPQGGLGALAPSGLMFSVGSEWFTIGFIKGLWDNFLPYQNEDDISGCIYPAHANTFAKFFMESLPIQISPYTRKSFYHLFHYFGEPYVPLNDQVPQVINVTHENSIQPGQAFFEVTADSGATVALVLNKELCSVQLSQGDPMNLTIPPPVAGDTLHITATGKNSRRYHAKIICSNPILTDEHLLDGISIYPNPASDFLIIRLDKPERINPNLRLFNVWGKEITIKKSTLQSSGKEIKIPLSGFVSGVYFINFTTDNKTFTFKFILKSQANSH